MKRMMRTKAIGAALAGAAAVATAGSAAAETVGVEYFLQSPASAAAVASGVSAANDCPSPLIFEGSRTQFGAQLAIHCRGSAETEFSVIISFSGEGVGMIPESFQYAG